MNTLLTAIALVFTGFTASAADITYFPESKSIHISGAIEKGDFQRFKDAYNLPGDAIWVTLHSPGGSVFEAEQIGRFIHVNKLKTYLSEDNFCASACGTIFLGGVERWVNTDSTLGIHPISIVQDVLGDFEDTIDTTSEQQILEIGQSSASHVALYFFEMLGSDFGKAFKLYTDATDMVPASDMYWATSGELRNTGYATHTVN